MKKIIYLDNASTSPVNKEVVKVMNEIMSNNCGNASSAHLLGEKAQELIIGAKKLIAREIGCSAQEIIFTSGGTESNNLAIRGIALSNPDKKKILISSIEHSSIYEECEKLKKLGYEIVEIPVIKEGFIDFNFLGKNISNALIVSVIHGNNEIGTLQDLKKIGEICAEHKVIFHTDAVQSFGKEKINVNDMKIDLLSASAHKINGPKGIGFLYLRNGIKIEPIIVGGGQENGLRGGTENVPAIAGFAKALEITKKVDGLKIKKMRDYFISELEKIGGRINGSKKERLANNINVSLPLNAENAVLLLSNKGIMCSTKSACLSKEKKENKTLRALKLSKKEIDGTLRLSISSEIGKKEIDFVLNELRGILNKV